MFTRVRNRIKILTWIIEFNSHKNHLCQTISTAENLLAELHYLLPGFSYLIRLWAYPGLVAQRIP